MPNLTSRSRASRRALLCLSTVLISGLAAPALAQTADAPEQFRNNDEHGVDLASGTYNLAFTEAAVGETGFKLMRFGGQSGWRDNWGGALKLTGSAGSRTATITFGDISEKFTESGSSWTNAKANGATLVSSGGTFEFVAADGTAIAYSTVAELSQLELFSTTATTFPGNDCSSDAYSCALPTSIARPNGEKYSLTWRVWGRCQYDTELSPTSCFIAYRLSDVRSGSSHALKIKYATDTWSTSYSAPPTGWTHRTNAKFFDLSQVYCDPEANNCDSVASIATASYANPSSGVTTVTNENNETWTFTQNATTGRLTGIKRPGASSDTTTIEYDGNGRVSSITEDGATKSYSWSVGSTTTVSTSTGAGENGSVTSTPAAGQPTSVTNGTSNTVTNTYDSSGRLTRETRPEGDYTNYTYDARGNLTEKRIVAKSGSGIADIVETASFDATCSNVATCNQPNYTIDARGNRTDFTYNSTHGGVTRVQAPAASSGGTRGEVNYTYSSLYPQVRDSGGNLGNAPDAESKVTQITACATAATCTGSANETKITLAYATPNLLVSSVTIAAGDASISATTAFTYDSADNIQTVDGPLSGSDDTTTYFYDAYNRRRGIVGPDPDGGGSQQRQAEKYTFDGESRVTRIERGYASAASDSALDAMTVADFVDFAYDANGNLTTQTVKSGSTAYALTQFGYDSDNRLVCTAIRMNPAVYGSLPTDACTASTLDTTNGPDRIAKNTYDASGRVTKVQTAYGQTEQADEVTLAYTANGQVGSLKDGEANLTTYEYDGVDRLRKTRYPVTTQGANSSSTTDYEQLTYDAAGNVTERRLRDGNTITFAYDNLDRLATRTPQGEHAVAFSHDLLNRLTQLQRSGDSITNSMSWDALGRMLSETQPYGSASYQHDAAGRVTRITWPDGFYAVYDYDAAGNVTAIRENGATSGVGVLASYAYDSLGRRTGVTRGNGTSTSYSWDALSRLASLGHDLSGSSHDLTVGSIGYNPAGQIASLTRSNDAYAWTGHSNVNRNDTVNGLNQTTATGSTSLGHDARGNVSAVGSSSYGYDKLNQMTAAPGVAMTYDPAGRLIAYNPGTTTRFAYAGSALTTETSTSGTVLRRYVPGPGIDEPIVWYEGSGTSDRRFLQADERGSIVAVADSSGASLAVNRYDEFGVPQSTNSGRFGYTGQAHLPEIGLSYYKARMYSPSLGRFMQTDPIGYGDGMNLYNYVGGDPVNGTDPSGSEIVVLNCPPDSQLAPDPRTEFGVRCLERPRFAQRSLVANGSVSGTPRRRPNDKNECAAALDELGTIITVSLNADVRVGGGLVGSIGRWENLQTGSVGFFATYGGGGAVSVVPGASATGGRYESLSAFVGYSASLDASFAILTGGLDFDASGNFTGFSLGLTTPGLSLGYAQTGTSIFGCRRKGG